MSDSVSRAAEALRSADVPPLPEELAAATVAAACRGSVHTRRRRQIMRYGIGAALAAGVLVAAGVVWNGGNSAAAQVAAAAEKAKSAKSVRLKTQLYREGELVVTTTRHIQGSNVRREMTFYGGEIANEESDQLVEII